VQTYCQTVTIQNTLNASVEATLRAGSPERWTLTPKHITLKPLQSLEVELQLRVLRFAQKLKAVQQGQRDVFHISAPYFEQKWHAIFFLAPDDAVSGASVITTHPVPQRQHQRRQALKALAGRKRGSSEETSSGPRGMDTMVPEPEKASVNPISANFGSSPLEDLARAVSSESTAYDPDVAATESTSTSKVLLPLPEAGSAANGNSDLFHGEVRRQETLERSSSTCSCCCHNDSMYHAHVAQRSSQQRMQQLEEQLDSAQNKIKVLQTAAEDRDCTIRL
jgi:hypothetical protein